jgi:hypothetical protein
VITVHQGVPNGEAAIETIGAPEDRSGYQQLTVGYRNLHKRRTSADDVWEPLKGRSSGRDVRPSQNAAVAYGTKA